MKEHPILFSSKMVKAILDSKKTMTRRVIKPQPKIVHGLYPDATIQTEQLFHNFDRLKCPYGQVGGRLWVRETWAYINNFDIDGSENYYEYKADKPNDLYPGDWPAEEAKDNLEAPRWKPSIFMPRWASRIILEITNIRVERLQEITEEDAKREGCQTIIHFYEVWNTINPPPHKPHFGTNPWVWVIEFKRCSQEVMELGL